MAEAIIVYGKSGSGKSRSLLNFGEDEVFLVNTIGKRLPFPKKFKYELKTDNVALIMDKLKAMPTKVAVIDDAGYLLTNAFMRGHSKPKAGSSSGLCDRSPHCRTAEQGGFLLSFARSQA